MEYLTVLSVAPAAKANGRVKFTIGCNTGRTLIFDLTETQTAALYAAIEAALA